MGMDQALKHHAKIAPTYAYVFDYMGNYHMGNLIGYRPNEWGKSLCRQKSTTRTTCIFFYLELLTTFQVLDMLRMFSICSIAAQAIQVLKRLIPSLN